MPERIFLDKASQPDAATLETAIGGAAKLWTEIERRLAAVGAVGRWGWVGRNYGWEKRYKRSSRPLVTLTPLDGSFGALVVLGRAETALAMTLPLHERGRHLLETTPQLHDGRWLFVGVESAADVEDVTTLIAAKLPSRVRSRLTSEISESPSASA